MKGPVGALLVLLYMMTLCSCEGDKSHTPPDCCFSFTDHQIPRNLVVDYYKTSGTCITDGVIFVTKRGHYICANPRHDWVQEYIRDLELNS